MNASGEDGRTGYTVIMETAVLVMLSIIVALVAIDAIGRLDERKARHAEPRGRDQTAISTQKIIVDLTSRRR